MGNTSASTRTRDADTSVLNALPPPQSQTRARSAPLDDGRRPSLRSQQNWVRQHAGIGARAERDALVNAVVVRERTRRESQQAPVVEAPPVLIAPPAADAQPVFYRRAWDESKRLWRKYNHHLPGIVVPAAALGAAAYQAYKLYGAPTPIVVAPPPVVVPPPLLPAMPTPLPPRFELNIDLAAAAGAAAAGYGAWRYLKRQRHPPPPQQSQQQRRKSTSSSRRRATATKSPKRTPPPSQQKRRTRPR
jgi:hypothetical protein